MPAPTAPKLIPMNLAPVTIITEHPVSIAQAEQPVRSDRDDLTPMAKRPSNLHHHRSISGRRGAQIAMFYSEDDPVKEAEEGPCRGGHSERPVEWREQCQDYDRGDRRQDKMPDPISASVASKCVGPSAAMLHVLIEQGNGVFAWNIGDD